MQCYRQLLKPPLLPLVAAVVVVVVIVVVVVVTRTTHSKRKITERNDINNPCSYTFHFFTAVLSRSFPGYHCLCQWDNRKLKYRTDC
jgi:hypothetical protein